MPSHTRVVTVLAFVCVLVLAGCSGGGGGGNAGGGFGGSGGSGAESGGSAGAATGGGAQTGRLQALQIQRALIKTGHVRLEIENFERAKQNLTTATRRWGGYVSASRETTHMEYGENVTTGRLVLRVPSRNFSALYAYVNATGTVLSARTNTTDVTSQLIDLEARLENLRAQRERLRNLYANASDTEAVLKVQKRLSSVQSKIERLKAQLKSLRGRVAYSTITVELREPIPEPTVEAWYDIGVLDAFLASIGGVITTLRAIVVALAYLTPYLLVFGVPAVAVGYVAYRRRGERRMK
ncbi:MAG TPA: DUF4349 domain-containing protein [Halococcus sp.]|nr:DUF4349 domain-containing protein [Halococcus sp.]